jgi:hypothetical protein
VAEQVTVNHLVAGSIPARAAISIKEMRNFWFSLKNVLGHFLATFGVLLYTALSAAIAASRYTHNGA